MSIKTGMVAIGDYTGLSPAAALAVLQGIVGSPDEVRSDGRAGGSNLDEMSPVARAQISVELDAATAGGQIGGKGVAYGTHTATTPEATANAAVIATGFADITLSKGSVTVWRAGAIVTGDAVITEAPSGSISVASGASTYDMAAGDIINWMAVEA